MPCTNCRRIYNETGVRPEHFYRGNIATCPEPHATNCRCQDCEMRRHPTIYGRHPAPTPAPTPAARPAPTPAARPAPTPAARPTGVASAHLRVIRFVSPTSTSPRCSELISECPVCLVDFDEGVASVNTSCGHKICVGCFTTMLVTNLRESYAKKTNCPMCRTTIVEKEGQ